MVHLGILDADDETATTWSRPDRRASLPRFEPVRSDPDNELRYAHQMLLAAAMASATIVAIAAVMMMRFF